MDREALWRLLGWAFDLEALWRLLGRAFDLEALRPLDGRAFDFECLRPLDGRALDLERLPRLAGRALDLELLPRLAGRALARGLGAERGRLRMEDLVGLVRVLFGLFHADGLDRELGLDRLALLFRMDRLFLLEERLLLKERPREGLDEPRDPLRDLLTDGLLRSSESVSAWAGVVGISSARAAKKRMNFCRMAHLPSAGTLVPDGGYSISFKINIFERTNFFQRILSSLDSPSAIMLASVGRRGQDQAGGAYMWLPSRDEALGFLRTHLKTTNLVRHCIATEAIMRSLAARFGEDEDLWGITGLFHDLDLDIVGGDMNLHGKTAVDILRKEGYPEEGLAAILAHNGDVLGVKVETRFDKALLAAETTTGLVVATTLVYMSKKIVDVKVKSVRKRMKEPRFAAGVDRDKVKLCEEIGIPLGEFLEVSVEAMRSVANEIGL